MYSKIYYEENKDKFLEWQRQYRKLNKEKVRANRIEYDKRNKDKINATKKEWRLKNKKRYKEQKKKDDEKYYQKHKQRISENKKQHQHEYYLKNKERIKAYYKQHSQLPQVKLRRAELERIRRRLNPKSNRSLYAELQEAMNNVRLRDKNTCQWQGCDITFKQARIDVHHIFPRSEYPDLELVEQYMICYCANHHGYWHRMRGDAYSEMIYPSQEYLDANPEELLFRG